LIAVAIAAGVDDVTIERFRFCGLAGGATGCIEAAGAAHRFRLLDSYIHGDFSSEVVDLTAAASADILVKGNTLINIDTGAGLGFAAHNSTTGFVRDNRAPT